MQRILERQQQAMLHKGSASHFQDYSALVLSKTPQNMLKKRQSGKAVLTGNFAKETSGETLIDESDYKWATLIQKKYINANSRNDLQTMVGGVAQHYNSLSGKAPHNFQFQMSSPSKKSYGERDGRDKTALNSTRADVDLSSIEKHSISLKPTH